MEAPEKSFPRLMDKKGGSMYIYSAASFLRAKGRSCVFFRYRRATFGDALCIKISDRKFYVRRIGAHVTKKNIKIVSK